jgi:hypothetical protein
MTNPFSIFKNIFDSTPEAVDTASSRISRGPAREKDFMKYDLTAGVRF